MTFRWPQPLGVRKVPLFKHLKWLQLPLEVQIETHRASPRPGAAGYPVPVDWSNWAVLLSCEPQW